MARGMSPETLRRWLGPALVAAGAAVALLHFIAAASAAGLPEQPNSAITPGAVASTSTDEVCTAGYSARHRLRYGEPGEHARWLRVIHAYGLTAAEVRGRIELDHILPLSAGGADSEANLWPEPLAQALRKDAIEIVAHQMVCEGKLPLHSVQEYFLGEDWLGVVGK